MTLVGNPFDMDQARLSALVSNELARGVTGMRTAFTTSAERAAAPEPHLVVVLNPMNEPVPEALCLTPETVRTGPAGEQVHVLAAFCRGIRCSMRRARKRSSGDRPIRLQTSPVADIQRAFPRQLRRDLWLWFPAQVA